MKEKKLAIKYYVDDIKASYIPNTSISKVLSGIEMSKISKMSLKFLDTNKLVSLKSLVSHEITFEEYIPLAKNEQEMRIQDSKRKEIEEENKKQQKQQIQNEIDYKRKLERREEKERQKALESDPCYIEKQKETQLKEKYDLDFYIEPKDYKKLISILEIVDSVKRLKEEDWIWVVDNKEYCTDKLRKTYHKNEAMFLMEEYEDKKDLWLVVNASSHYRKGDSSNYAISILSKINLENINDNKLKSAICTTHGGAKRDIKKWAKAIQLAEYAHKYQPEDYRPCTLFGAIYMETQKFDIGYEWYNKAIDRGFKPEDRDTEIKAIYNKANKANKESLRRFLLGIDPVRYCWLNK